MDDLAFAEWLMKNCSTDSRLTKEGTIRYGWLLTSDARHCWDISEMPLYTTEQIHAQYLIAKETKAQSSNV